MVRSVVRLGSIDNATHMMGMKMLLYSCKVMEPNLIMVVSDLTSRERPCSSLLTWIKSSNMASRWKDCRERLQGKHISSLEITNRNNLTTNTAWLDSIWNNQDSSGRLFNFLVDSFSYDTLWTLDLNLCVGLSRVAKETMNATGVTIIACRWRTKFQCLHWKMKSTSSENLRRIMKQ